MNGDTASTTAGITSRSAWARSPEGAAWWALGAWIRLAIAGAMLAAAGLAMLFSTPGVPALATIAAGAATAALAARRVAQRLPAPHASPAPARASARDAAPARA